MTVKKAHHLLTT